MTYSLLVSNVGWVRNDVGYSEAKELYDDYVASGDYEQISLWASDNPDPIEMCDTSAEPLEED